MNKPSPHTIIWDWNGTLLDDAEICRQAINNMLSARNLPELSLEKYRQVFTFPVIEYYKVVGFDFEKEDWDPVAMEFINLYLKALPQCSLTPSAPETLLYIKRQGFRQAIVSAMQHDALQESVQSHGIEHFFEFIGGIGDHYAHSKLDNALTYFADSKLNPQEVTLIGDTLHDSEVARELGCRCILVATGHQAYDRLTSAGVPVVEHLGQVKNLIDQK